MQLNIMNRPTEHRLKMHKEKTYDCKLYLRQDIKNRMKGTIRNRLLITHSFKKRNPKITFMDGNRTSQLTTSSNQTGLFRSTANGSIRSTLKDILT